MTKKRRVFLLSSLFLAFVVVSVMAFSTLFRDKPAPKPKRPVHRTSTHANSTESAPAWTPAPPSPTMSAMPTPKYVPLKPLITATDPGLATEIGRASIIWLLESDISDLDQLRKLIMDRINAGCGKTEQYCKKREALLAAEAYMSANLASMIAKGKSGRAYNMAEALAGLVDPNDGMRPMRGIDVAVAASDSNLLDRYVKERIQDIDGPNDKVNELAGALSGYHLALPDLIHNLEEEDPARSTLIKQALRQQHESFYCFGIRAALATGNQDQADYMRSQLGELDSVNEDVDFMSTGRRSALCTPPPETDP